MRRFNLGFGFGKSNGSPQPRGCSSCGSTEAGTQAPSRCAARRAAFLFAIAGFGYTSRLRHSLSLAARLRRLRTNRRDTVNHTLLSAHMPIKPATSTHAAGHAHSGRSPVSTSQPPTHIPLTKLKARSRSSSFRRSRAWYIRSAWSRRSRSICARVSSRTFIGPQSLTRATHRFYL
jgi:hypothetical protein